MNLLTSSQAAVGSWMHSGLWRGGGFLEAEEIVRVGTTGKSQGLFLKCEM